MSERESGADVPTVLSPEAWKMSMIIDQEVAGLFSEYGIVRKEGHSKMTVVIAKMIQLAINQYCDRVHPAAKEQGR